MVRDLSKEVSGLRAGEQRMLGWSGVFRRSRRQVRLKESEEEKLSLRQKELL